MFWSSFLISHFVVGLDVLFDGLKRRAISLLKSDNGSLDHFVIFRMFDRLCSAFLFLSAVVRHSIELLSTPFALRDVDCLRCKVFTSISGPQREQTATTRLYERV